MQFNHLHLHSYEIVLYFVSGYLFHNVQTWIGMRCLQDGVLYYGEVHLSFWNSFIHTIFMPMTMFGMYMWIPALFQLSIVKANTLKQKVMLFYIGLYARISIINTLFIIVWYYKSFIDSAYVYAHLSNSMNIILGLTISIVALLIQEVLGHYIGGDDASRMEAIPNAILYAPYYSISHLLEK